MRRTTPKEERRENTGQTIKKKKSTRKRSQTGATWTFYLTLNDLAAPKVAYKGRRKGSWPGYGGARLVNVPTLSALPCTLACDKIVRLE